MSIVVDRYISDADKMHEAWTLKARELQDKIERITPASSDPRLERLQVEATHALLKLVQFADEEAGTLRRLIYELQP